MVGKGGDGGDRGDKGWWMLNLGLKVPWDLDLANSSCLAISSWVILSKNPNLFETPRSSCSSDITPASAWFC
jgi:hypothetical protein